MSFRRPGRIWIPEAPHLILGRGPCPRPTVEIFATLPTARYEGRFKAELIDAASGRVKQTAYCDTPRGRNLVVDTGLDGIGNGDNVLAMTNWVGVGTGNTAPANNQTTLVSQVGTRISRTTTGDGTNGSGPAFAYWFYQRVYLFLEAEGNGNLTEVGVFKGQSTGPMWSRQLFKDGAGNPTVVTKTNTDQLKITYEWRIYIPTGADPTGVVLISGTNYTWTSRPQFTQNAGAWGHLGLLDNTNWSGPFAQAVNGGVLAAVSGRIASPGGYVANDTNVLDVYTAGNFYRDVTHKWEPATGNLAGGIGGIETWANAGVCSFQMIFNPFFAKDATKRLTLVIRRAWARYP